MEKKTKFSPIYFLIFLASVAGFIFAVYSHWPWLPLILPFIATSFVKAFDII